MSQATPGRLASVGGLVLTLGGIINLMLGLQAGAWFSVPDPGGRMGHIGIIDGLIAFLAGLAIVLLLPRLYRSRSQKQRLIGAILTPILGHIGASWGALYLGLAGLALCYLAGIWLLVIFLRQKPPLAETEERPDPQE